MQAEQWILFGKLLKLHLFIALLGVIQSQQADAGEENDHAKARPDNQITGWPVANQFIRRPVVRIGDIIIGPEGDTRPGCPEEEGVHLLHSGDIFDGVDRDSIGFPLNVPFRGIHK